MAIRQRANLRSGIISAVEISYFRSFYKVYLDQIDRLNIFFGENDTGKSNVMRALNLFFNGQIDDSNDFDFDIDLSSKRAAEAGDAVDVRKFLYVKVWFRTPAAHRRALGTEFYVKRTWSQSTAPDFRQEESRHIDTSGKRQSLTKLLDKIAFTYIPAVKSHDVYSGLLRSAYQAISGSPAFSEALKVFTDEIRTQTKELGESLNRSLGMSSELAPPTDLADLFGTLDFQTLAGAGDPMSLLKQRGDGVQARHIPEIMSFISKKDSHQHHVWGIEEPENSLSISSSIILSERLKAIAQSDDIQIFLTTHSPAFYSLSGRGVHKTFIKSVNGNAEVLNGTEHEPERLMEFMGDRFYLPLVAKGVQEAKEKADTLQRAVSELEASIETRDRPLLFVEGPTEETLFNHLLKMRESSNKLEVVPLGGASHAGKFATMTEDLIRRILGDRTGYVLLDSDRSGREVLPRQVDRPSAKAGWIASQNSLLWRILPISAEGVAAYDAAGVQDAVNQGTCLEDCYSSRIRREAVLAGVYELGEPRPSARQTDLFMISDALRNEDHQFYLRSPTANKKTAFVDWLIDTNQSECDILDNILDDILKREQPQKPEEMNVQAKAD